MGRQQLFIEQNNTPVWAVLDEAVLRRQMGSPEVMQSQYRRLLELSGDNNITIRVYHSMWESTAAFPPD
jgi:hypothetical protein